MRLLLVLLTTLLAASVVLPGCGAEALPGGVPAGSVKVAELVAPTGARSNTPAKLQAEQGGALYVYDASHGEMTYSGTVAAGDVIHLYESGVAVAGRLPSRTNARTMYERRVASFNPGNTYQVYFQAGGVAKNPTSDEGSPLTRPFEERSRRVEREPPGGK
jgi:hypothetical protein